MSVKEETRTPEEIEDEVMNTLPQLSAAQLEEVCETLELTVAEGIKGKKRDLFKFVMKSLCDVEDSEDGNLANILLLDSLIHKDPTEESTAESKKVNGATAAVSKVEQVKVDKKKSSSSSEFEKPKHESSRVNTEMIRWNNWKISGTIGGQTAEKQMSFASLKYQVECGKKMGLPESIICPAVIKAVCSTNEIREFLEDTLVSDPDSANLDYVLEILHSQCLEQDSAHYFLEMQNLVQAHSESLRKFVSKLISLKQKVTKLSREEGLEYDKTLVSKRFFHALFTGIRNDTVRAEFREKCKDTNISDPKLLQYANEVMALEKERQKKLGKKVDFETASVSPVAAETKNTTTPKSEKINPFILIEELKATHKQEMLGVKAELAEIKNAVINRNNENGNGQAHQAAQNNNNNTNGLGRGRGRGQNGGRNFGGRNFGNPGGGRRRPTGRCEDCLAANAFRCFHCFHCGGEGHQMNNCPAQDNQDNVENEPSLNH